MLVGGGGGSGGSNGDNCYGNDGGAGEALATVLVTVGVLVGGGGGSGIDNIGGVSEMEGVAAVVSMMWGVVTGVVEVAVEVAMV